MHYLQKSSIILISKLHNYKYLLAQLLCFCQIQEAQTLHNYLQINHWIWLSEYDSVIVSFKVADLFFHKIWGELKYNLILLLVSLYQGMVSMTCRPTCSIVLTLKKPETQIYYNWYCYIVTIHGTIHYCYIVNVTEDHRLVLHYNYNFKYGAVLS